MSSYPVSEPQPGGRRLRRYHSEGASRHCCCTSRRYQASSPSEERWRAAPELVSRNIQPKQSSMTSSWLERQASSHSVQLAGAAIASGLVVAGAIYGYQSIRRDERLENLKASIPEADDGHYADLVTDQGLPSKLPASTWEEDRAAIIARRAQHGDYDPDLISEQLTRTSSFLGAERFAKLRDSFVIVVGVGGVGSHCISALARSGVSRLRIIDFDQVTLSSLNRHAVALLADVGTSKVECVRKRMQAVAPWVLWEVFNEIWKVSEGDRLLGAWSEGKGPKPDFVVDAIDNIDSKVALIEYCHNNRIQVISSMGAGSKSDPSRIFVGDISSSIEDPLSRVTRRRLRAFGIATGIPVIYSTEKPGPGKASLLPLPDEEFEKGQVNELSVLPDFRARILPVLGTMPAIFGYTAANYVIMKITGYPHERIEGKSRDKMYDSILSQLQGLEERLLRQRLLSEGHDKASAEDGARGLKIPVTKDDVGYLVEEVYRGKSIVSGVPARLALIRWRASPSESNKDSGSQARKDLDRQQGHKAADLNLVDLVCMTKDEAAVHEREILNGKRKVEDLYDQKVIDMVQQRMREERSYEQYR